MSDKILVPVDLLLIDLHTKQIKNRVPIFIAKRIESWSSALSAVSYLKQCLNNADIENEQLKTEKDKAVLEERERLLSSEFLKPYFTHFFYWWYNQQGTNTEQGFDDWYESGNSIANEIRKEP